MAKGPEAGAANASHKALVEDAVQALLMRQEIDPKNRSEVRKALIKELMSWTNSALLELIPAVETEQIYPDDVTAALRDAEGALYTYHRGTTRV